MLSGPASSSSSASWGKVKTVQLTLAFQRKAIQVFLKWHGFFSGLGISRRQTGRRLVSHVYLDPLCWIQPRPGFLPCTCHTCSLFSDSITPVSTYVITSEPYSFAFSVQQSVLGRDKSTCWRFWIWFWMWHLTTLSFGEFLMSKLLSLICLHNKRSPFPHVTEFQLLGAELCLVSGGSTNWTAALAFMLWRQNLGARVYGWAQSVNVWMGFFVKW